MASISLGLSTQDRDRATFIREWSVTDLWNISHRI